MIFLKLTIASPSSELQAACHNCCAEAVHDHRQSEDYEHNTNMLCRQSYTILGNGICFQQLIKIQRVMALNRSLRAFRLCLNWLNEMTYASKGKVRALAPESVNFLNDQSIASEAACNLQTATQMQWRQPT